MNREVHVRICENVGVKFLCVTRLRVHIMKKTVHILILLAITLTVKATSQTGDIIIWQGDTLTLFSNPLELRSDWTTLKKNITTEIENEDRRLYPQKYEKDEVEALFSTGCWRGYIAEWKLEDNKIYLNNIYACNDYKVKVDLKKLFQNEFKDDLLFANWLNSKLIVPKGKCIELINLDYKSIYEKEIVIEFKNGLLTNIKTYNNYVSKRSKFSKDPNPNNFIDFMYSRIDWDKLPDLTNKHIQVSIGIQPNSKGHIDSIIGEYTYLYDGMEIITDRNNIFIKEAIRIAKLLPDWEVIYQRGIIVSRGLTIVFDENHKKKYMPNSGLKQ
jgi:hypothetical protein